MPALNFQKQFAPLVESGEKRQTIRAMRKHPVKMWAPLYLFTGMRTKACRRLRAGKEDRAHTVIDITITRRGVQFPEYVTGPDKEQIAKADGFENFEAMLAWFKKTHGLPFKGQLIRW